MTRINCNICVIKLLLFFFVKCVETAFVVNVRYINKLNWSFRPITDVPKLKKSGPIYQCTPCDNTSRGLKQISSSGLKTTVSLLEAARCYVNVVFLPPGSYWPAARGLHLLNQEGLSDVTEQSWVCKGQAGRTGSDMWSHAGAAAAADMTEQRPRVCQLLPWSPGSQQQLPVLGGTVCQYGA